VKLRIRIVAGFITVLFLMPARAQLNTAAREPIAVLLTRLDSEHDYINKDKLLRQITGQYPDAGAALLRLAQSSASADTRWMAIRGMATLHYTASVQFLEASLKDPDALVRANAARALSDLRIESAAPQILAMFIAETDDAALQQGSLALRIFEVKAAVPFLREKIPMYTGQTRGWLLQALGTLGTRDDVPFVGGYLDADYAAGPATDALQQLTGVNFGYPRSGLNSFPTHEALAARAWWHAHKDAWPHCDDCPRN
jgi:HEAT repeat protein